jgi:hypothetical protein
MLALPPITNQIYRLVKIKLLLFNFESVELSVFLKNYYTMFNHKNGDWESLILSALPY